MPRGRSLFAVLVPGEIVQYKCRGQIYEAYFDDGVLIRTDDGSRYDTPTAFANDVSGNSVSGWLHCRVERGGVSIKLQDLHELLPKAIAPSILVDGMPPPPKPLKIKRQSLTVQHIEAAAPPLPVLGVKQIHVRPFSIGSTNYWRNTGREKLYARLPSGGVGAYVGRWNGASIDDVPDSDAD
jgi:hypothetical protein